MDAFFASVEVHDHPEWRGKPLIVGSGPHERGVVSTCSYEARRFGVHSAMPSRTAYSLCPQAIFVRPRMERYQEVSQHVFEIFERYSPYIEGVSIDEAYLDITGNLHLWQRGEDTDALGAARRLAEALRADIRRECGITCSVGIAPNRLLAKIGSEERKPDGLTVLPFTPDAIAAFLAPKPVQILRGVGKATLDALKPFGIRTCGDIQRTGYPPALVDYAFGRDDDTVYWQAEAEKSVSREYTFDEDEYSREAVRAKLLELVVEVGSRFRTEPRWAATARIKLRDVRFNTITRQCPFPKPARDDISFREAALALFDREFPSGQERLPGGIRLIGFGVTNLRDSPDDAFAPLLFEDESDLLRRKRERLSDTLDRLRNRGVEI